MTEVTYHRRDSTMEAWVLLLFTSDHTQVRIEMQSEDACVTAAKQLSERNLHPRATCVNTWDGRVLYFKHGKQIQ